MRKFIWIFIAIVLALFVSCDETSPTTELAEANIAISMEKALEIESNGDVVEYRYESIPLFEDKHLIGATGGYVRLGTDTSSALPIGYLSQGKWHFNVQGLNDEGIVIVTGSTEQFLEKGLSHTIPITVTTDRTIGTGGVSFTFDSDATSQSNMSFIVRYRNIDQTTWQVKNSGFTRTMRVNDSEVTFSGRVDGLASGHWELHFILVDNGVYIGGESVTVQIVAGRTTTISGIILPSKHIGLEMMITSPGFVNGTLGNDVKIYKDQSATVTWTNESDATVYPDSWIWMVDGIIDESITSSTNSYTYHSNDASGYGEHQISVIALHHVSGQELEIGSASVKVEVIRRLANITFDAGSGMFPDGTSSITLTQDTYDNPQLPKIPSRIGYVFAGWMYGSDLAVTAMNEVIPAVYRCEGNRTLTAAWVQSVYNLTLVYGGGGIRKVYGSVSGGSTRELPAQETKTDISFGASLVPYIETPLTRYGYIFRGWYTEENGMGTQIYGNSWAISNYGWTSDVTLYAWWTLKEYTVTYKNAIYYGNYSWNASQLAAQAETEVVKTRSNPLGFSIAAGQVIYYTFTNTSTGETGRLYMYVTTGCNASGSPQAKTMAVIKPAGEDKQNDVAIDCPYGAMPQPKIQGLKFLGWFTSPTGGTQKQGTDIFLANNIAEDNETLYAHWEEGNIHVEVTNGYGTTLRTGTVAMGSIYGNLIPSSPTRTGYSFQGWYIQGTNDMVVAGSIVTVPDDHVIEARWVGNTYTVSFVPIREDVTATSQKTVQYGSAYGELPALVRPGYGGTGWKTADGSQTITSDTIVSIASNHTLSGDWNAVTMPITLNAGEGQMYIGGYNVGSIILTGTYGNTYNNLKTPSGASASLPESVTWYGHTFQGWYTEAAGGARVIGSQTITTELAHTLYAHYSTDSVTIKFWRNYDGDDYSNPTGSMLVEQRSRSFGDSLGALPNVNRTGYTFLGWFTTPSGGDLVSASTAITTTGTINFYAHWQIMSIQVTLNYGGGVSNGNTEKAISVTYGNTYGSGNGGSLPSPTKTGYNFSNTWQRDTDSATITSGSSMTLVNAHTLVAQYTPKTMSVTLDANGGTVLGSSTKTLVGTYDSQYNEMTLGGVVPNNPNGGLPDPTRTGYEFGGWYESLAFNTSPIQPGTTISKENNHTLYAKWNGKSVRVIYDWGDSTANRLLEYAVDTYGQFDTTSHFPEPTKNGYAIEGWYYESSYINRVEPTHIVMTDGDHTIYAKWLPISYRYTLDSEDLDSYWSGSEVNTLINSLGNGYTALSQGQFGNQTYDFIRKNGVTGGRRTLYSGTTTGAEWTQQITQTLNIHLRGEQQKWKRNVTCTACYGNGGWESSCDYCTNGKVWTQCSVCSGSGRLPTYEWSVMNTTTRNTHGSYLPDNEGFPIPTPGGPGELHTTVEYELIGGSSQGITYTVTTTNYRSVLGDYENCYNCSGRGGWNENCRVCGGDGEIWHECGTCDGNGYTVQTHTTTSTITVEVNGSTVATETYNDGNYSEYNINVPNDATVRITVVRAPSTLDGWTKDGSLQSSVSWYVYDPAYSGKITLLKRDGTALNFDSYLSGYTKGKGSASTMVNLVAGGVTISSIYLQNGEYGGNLQRYYLFPGYLNKTTYAGGTEIPGSTVQATYGGFSTSSSPRTATKEGVTVTPTQLSWSSSDLYITASPSLSWISGEYITGFSLDVMQ